MDPVALVLVAAAALVAGAVNAIAGGGSLITFPVLLAAGLPAVTASMTNTVAMCPGYLGATFAQRRELAGQGRRFAVLLPLSLIGSLGGALLLMNTGERAFQVVVPFLLAFASLLVAAQGRIRVWLLGRRGGRESLALAIVPIGGAAVYGAYFGAGLGVMILAVLAVVIDDSLVHANALKQAVSLAVNTCAAIVFLAYAQIDWSVAGVIAAASLVGGVIGGRLVSRIPEVLLRWLVVAIGLGAAAYYFERAVLA